MGNAVVFEIQQQIIQYECDEGLTKGVVVVVVVVVVVMVVVGGC
jgi:hypothetical protein